MALCVHMCLGIRRLTRRNIIPLASLGLSVSLILCSCFRDFAESGPKFVKFVLFACLSGFLCAGATHACCRLSYSRAWQYYVAGATFHSLFSTVLKCQRRKKFIKNWSIKRQLGNFLKCFSL